MILQSTCEYTGCCFVRCYNIMLLFPDLVAILLMFTIFLASIFVSYFIDLLVSIVFPVMAGNTSSLSIYNLYIYLLIVSMYQSNSLSVCPLSICPLSVCQSIHPFLCLSVFLSVCLLSIRKAVYLSESVFV